MATRSPTALEKRELGAESMLTGYVLIRNCLSKAGLLLQFVALGFLHAYLESLKVFESERVEVNCIVLYASSGSDS
jgi:hypothetical protein